MMAALAAFLASSASGTAPEAQAKETLLLAMATGGPPSPQEGTETECNIGLVVSSDVCPSDEQLL